MSEATSAGLLAAVRVLDLGRYIAAPLAAAMLADLGAEVIRVEPLEGGADRDVMPIDSEVGGALYHQMNRGKRSLALDIGTPEGRRVFEALVATADVVIVNMPPKQLARAGLDYETLRAIKGDLVFTTITAYAPSGPDRDRTGFDGTGQALSGAMHITGDGGMPMRAAVSYVDYATGMTAAYATLAALFQRWKTGEGQHVEASLLGTALTIMNPILIEAATGARFRDALGNRSPIAGPSDVYAGSDGWVMVQVIGDRMFERWAAVVGRPELTGDPAFASDIGRGENGEALSAIMRAWCAGKSCEEILALLSAERVPCVRVLKPAEALATREVAEGGFFAAGAALPVVSPMAQLAGTVPYRAAPGLGSDSDAILKELGLSEAERRDLAKRRMA